MPDHDVPDDILITLDTIYSSISTPIATALQDASRFPYDQMLVGLAAFGLLLATRKLFRHVIFRLLGLMFRSGQQEFRENLKRALEGPVEFLPLVLGTFLAFEAIKVDVDSPLKLFSGRVVETLFIVFVYWSLIALVEPLVEQLRPRTSKLTDSVVDWIRKAMKCFIAFFALAAILQLWGIRIGPLLAGMGIAGAAVALGAQALFKNLISGVLILLERRFQYGDWVKVQGVVEGTVESIGFRSTRIRQFDDSAVQVPNSDFADNAVINYSQMRKRRIFWIIGVPYSTTIDQIRTIRDQLENHIHTCNDFVPPSLASTFVRLDSFGASSINIMVYCFTHTTNWGEWLAVKERLAYRIMDIVEDAGSSFAFPSTSLYVESLPGAQPEPFVPPDGSKPRITPMADSAAAAPLMPEAPRL